MPWNEPLTPQQIEQAEAGATATLAASREILAITIERLTAQSSNPNEWTGARLAQMFITAAYEASHATLNPMDAEDYVRMLRSHADAVEQHSRQRPLDG